MFKLILYWNVLPGTGEEYLEFLSQELGPTMLELGIRPTDAWLTQYGDGPQVRLGGIAEDLEDLQEALESDEWLEVKKKLLNYVTDYHQKIVKATGEFQL